MTMMNFLHQNPALILEKMLKEGRGTIVDVRTTKEFQAESLSESKNIPLTDLPDRLDDIRDMEYPILCCCDSGIRSSQAYGFISSKGIDCMHAGRLSDVRYLLSMDKI